MPNTTCDKSCCPKKIKSGPIGEKKSRPPSVKSFDGRNEERKR